MFLQIIQGKVGDPDLLRRQIDSWRRDVKPGAVGFLGSTSGMTDDGQFIVMARFESEEAAHANSERAEQGAWWEATAPAFDGEPTFTDCPEVDIVLRGGSNDAGFVQVMQGRSVEPQALRAAGEAMEEELQKLRPDVLGGIVGWHGDRYFTQAMYFISEEAARKGESEMAGDPQAEDWDQMIEGEMSFLDLRDPAYD
jgi:hypothetical protein